MNRNRTKQVKIGNLVMGGNDNIIIQSMTNIKTSKTKLVIKQINELEKIGCELIRVSILDKEDALAIKTIKKHINIPLVADIHFESSLAILAIKSGADKIRINPGNFPQKDLEKVVNCAKKYHIPIRIGINSGSLENNNIKNEVKSMYKSCKKYIRLLKKMKFNDIVISAKSSNIENCVAINEKISKKFKYPIHLGLTEAGDTMSSVVSSTYALTYLLNEGIGNTIRVSINGDSLQEVVAAKEILRVCELRNDVPTLIACPTCGRCKTNTTPIVESVRKLLNETKKNITVAIMGCIVNGPGEAKKADIGIACGNKSAVLFKKGIIVKKIEEKDILKVLKEEIKKLS